MEMYPVLIYYESIKVIFRFEDNLENRNRIHYGSKGIMNMQRNIEQFEPTKNRGSIQV
jgi:hypothetical protein